MLVIVYQRALAAYVSRVLPSLEVPGVPVMTFGSWAEAARRAAFPLLDWDLTDETPPAVMRAKAHGAFLRIIDDRQAALAAWCRERAGPGSGRQGRGRRGAGVLGRHLRARRRAGHRAGAMGARHDARPRHPQRRRERRSRPAHAHARRHRRVGGHADRSRRARRRVRPPRARGVLAGPARRHSPLVRRAGAAARRRPRPSVASSDGGEDERYALDAEDEALLLRIYQRQRGRIPDGPAARRPWPTST